MAIDLLNPPVSRVARGMEGKSFLIYGSNRTGKTKQATRFPKPIYLAFEAGLNGIDGIPYLSMTSWADYVEFVQTITTRNPEMSKKYHDLYQTIVLDEASIIGQLCSDAVCEQYGVNDISEGKSGYGLWQQLSDTFSKPLHKLMNAGYTTVFIAHEGTRNLVDEAGNKYTKIFPAGTPRSIDPICNAVDFIIYVRPNPNDPETGAERISSAFLSNTPFYLAGSRFDGMPEKLEEFTAEALENAINQSVKFLEKKSGSKAVSFDEQQKIQAPVEGPAFDEMVAEIRDYAKTMFDAGRSEDYRAIVEAHLGAGNGVQNATPRQSQMLRLILTELRAANEKIA